MKIRNDVNDDEKFGLKWSKENNENENKSKLKNCQEIPPSSKFDLFEKDYFVSEEESKEFPSTEISDEHSLRTRTGHCEYFSGISDGLVLGQPNHIPVTEKEKTNFSSGISGTEFIDNGNKNVFIDADESLEKINSVGPRTQNQTIRNSRKIFTVTCPCA